MTISSSNTDVPSSVEIVSPDPSVNCPIDGVVCWMTDEGPTCGFCGWPHRERHLLNEPILVAAPVSATDAQRPAEVHVAKPTIPAMRLVPDRLDFGVVAADTTADRRVDVRDRTGQSSDLVAVGELPAWLRVEPQPSGKIKVRVDAGQWKGESSLPFRTTISLMDRNTNAVAKLDVAGEFVIPRMQGALTAVRFGRLQKGQTRVASMKIQNANAGELVLKQIVLDQSWLRAETVAAPDAGTVELRLTALASTAGPGQHQAEVQILSNDRTRPLVAIPVYLRVVV